MAPEGAEMTGWRSPSGVTEDRNNQRMSTFGGLLRLAVALWGD
ncbi:hypothetical protein [Streptomyces galilaeus]|uniref:Uncharacterized protein n=1 Tax=Streptomyces galilaeus TaxID=33899 RepID=A0ABW9ITL1_STRGJ